MIYHNPSIGDVTVGDIVTPEYIRQMLREIREYGGNEHSLLLYYKSRLYDDPYYYPEEVEDARRGSRGWVEDKYAFDDTITESEEFEDYVEEWLADRFETVKSNIEQRIDCDGDLEIFRGMDVTPNWPERLVKYQGHLGIYWTMDNYCARAYDAAYEGIGKLLRGSSVRIPVVLQTYVPEEAIDWIQTFWHQMHPDYGDAECEIRLFKNTPIQLNSACFSLDQVRTSLKGMAAAPILEMVGSATVPPKLLQDLQRWWQPETAWQWCIHPLWQEKIDRKTFRA